MEKRGGKEKMTLSLSRCTYPARAREGGKFSGHRGLSRRVFQKEMRGEKKEKGKSLTLPNINFRRLSEGKKKGREGGSSSLPLHYPNPSHSKDRLLSGE